MSDKPIIEAFTKLVKLNESLLKIAKRKTDIIVNGDTDALTKLLSEEKLHVKAIRTMEIQLKKEMDSSTGKSNSTLSAYLDVASDEEANELTKLQEQLLGTVEQLQEKNDLNQRLLQDSLAFVHLSMDVMEPDPESYNYGSTDQEDSIKASHSAFDSKA